MNPKGAIGQQNMNWQALAALDTQGIHDYVFSSTELAEIRGASARLNVCTTTRWARLARRYGGDPIFCAGGNAMVLFTDSERAGSFCRAAEDVLWSVTGRVVAASHVEERRGGEDFPGNEADGIRARALEAIERRKHSGEDSSSKAWNPYAKFCEVCGAGTAEKPLRAGTGVRWACGSCAKGSVRRGYWFRRLQEWMGASPEYGVAQARSLREAPDLNHIGAEATPEGYLAFVYFDINDLGSLLRGADDREDYRRLSHAVQESVRDSLMATLVKILPPARAGTRSTPFEVFLMGGDDAVLAVPAHHAAGVAARMFEGFGREFVRHNAGEPPRMSAGVVYCHSHFPAYIAIGRAEELIRSAKRRAHESEGRENGLDYLTITNAIELPVERLRREQFMSRDGLRSLVSRPLTWSEFQAVQDLCDILKQIPRSQLDALYDLLFRSRHQAVLDYCYWLTRLKEGPRDKLRSWCGNHGMFASPFDCRGATPFIDAIELLSFGGGKSAVLCGED